MILEKYFFFGFIRKLYFPPLIMSPFVGIILCKALFLMSSQISYKANRNRIKKKLSFFEGGHQLEKLEFALAIAQTKGDEKKSVILRKRIVELGGNVEEPGT